MSQVYKLSRDSIAFYFCLSYKAGRTRGLNRCNALGLLALFTLLSAPAWAQNVSMGEIRGTVTDESGAVMPGVSVTITNLGTNQVVERTTDAGGVYDAMQLMPGTYSVTFKKEGFQTLVRSGIILDVGALGVNGTLKVGSTSQRIDVVGAAPLVQTETAKISLTMEQKAVLDLPNTGNSWFGLTALIPGVAPSSGGNEAGGSGVSIGGTQTYEENWLIDGGHAFLFGAMNPDGTAALESIAEIDVDAHNYGGEYGNGMAVFNVITKSGTNKFHGMGFEYVQNNILSARNFFAMGVPPYRYNRFGGNVGGPIKKNKAFFFFGYQRNPVIYYSPSYAIVPTAAERGGDFSAANLGTLYDPYSLQFVNGQYVRTALPGNQIPTADLSAQALNIQNYIKMPNITGVYNFYDSPYAGSKSGIWSIRVDYDFAPSNRLDFSGTLNRSDGSSHPSMWAPIGQGGINGRDPIGQITDTWNITPQVVNIARFATDRQDNTIYSDDVGKGYNTSLGIPDLPGNAFPDMNIGGPLSISIGAYSPGFAVENSFDGSDMVAWVKGKHIIKFGVELARYSDNAAWPDLTAGNFSFSGIFTRNPSDPTSAGLGYADFLYGLPNSWNYSAELPVGFSDANQQFFISDDYKIRPNLTITMGLRFDHIEGFKEAFNRIMDFSPTLINPATNTPGAVCFAGRPGCPTSWPAPITHFNPRLGVAWSPKRDWSVRAGYGIYDMFFGYGNNGPWGWAEGVKGNESSEDLIHPIFSLAQGPPSNAYIYPVLSAFTPAYANGTIMAYTPYHLVLGYTQQYQLDVQHEFHGGVVADVAYVGLMGVHLGFGRDINAVPPQDMHYIVTSPQTLYQYTPYPQYYSILATLSDAHSNYNALQVRVQKRMTRNLGFIVNYTYSKTMDNGTSGGWSPGFNIVDNYQQPDNPQANYGLSQTDCPHIISASIMYNLPFGAGRALLNHGGIANAIVGGWEATSVVQLHSGMPFTPTVGTTNLSGTYNDYAAGWWPNRIASGKLSNPTIQEWFDPSAFTVPDAGTFGDSARNILMGPDWRSWDLSLAKNWKLPWLGEGGQFQFRCDATNFLNHPNFGQPNASIATPAAGIITSASAARNIQFGFRLYF